MLKVKLVRCGRRGVGFSDGVAGICSTSLLLLLSAVVVSKGWIVGIQCEGAASGSYCFDAVVLDCARWDAPAIVL